MANMNTILPQYFVGICLHMIYVMIDDMNECIQSSAYTHCNNRNLMIIMMMIMTAMMMMIMTAIIMMIMTAIMMMVMIPNYKTIKMSYTIILIWYER